MADATPKETVAEKAKRLSNGLRGSLSDSLKDEHTGSLRDLDQLLIKFHGIYQQDDRDKRLEREEKKLDKHYTFMIRMRIPGGMIGPTHWEKAQSIAGKYSTGTIKITTRQTIQLHGIIKSNLKPTIKAFNEVFLDSIAACGDVNRNVTTTAHPASSKHHTEINKLANEISRLLLPKTRAYYEIWLDENKLAEKTEDDPLYRDVYLPRKFKIGIAIPPWNDVDIYTNDIGLVAIEENGAIIGYNVNAGGGLGTTHGNVSTYPRLASIFGYVPKDKVLKAVYEIVTTQRDFGNREDRKLSRLKYTIDRMGIDNFKKEVESRTGFNFEPERKFEFKTRSDSYGWAQDHQGLWHYTLFVENGLVVDKKDFQIKTALNDIAKTRRASFRFTCNQNVIISDVKGRDLSLISDILAQYKLDGINDATSHIRKNSMACVALSTCPLALAEAQRYLPLLMTKVEGLLTENNLIDQPITIRMTGCPNGCARPYNAEIGLIGTAYGKYNLHLGADFLGTRLNKKFKENLDEGSILKELNSIFAMYAKEKLSGEYFGDFCIRKNLVSI
ncbi:NADPH-dependent assimilatory sulfite reductase hemoprotein subunit [Leptospira sp. GIMC2001]|uniref:NADPH-dependent assimilatory sulfite reductase hemoprotein subunit n=1 Tax=Leptospira sp. GIMC2001 TaxID=1513297 RepID=UPI00234B145D|nr:NADPH-dependent assimilatory sulfite reductase hemoprotein subunit [Leptospira sp. GIMC2001]WCL50927.1 NADPH-dependent assimilatory sulfite reductase hemoprotein subunit [Leptospira sp. GIMC2001]